MSVSFYTVETLSRELAISTKTVRRALKAGSLRFYRIGRVYRIAYTDAQAWIGAGRAETA